MPGDAKKLVWISISIGAFILIVLLAAFFLFRPGPSGADTALGLSPQAAAKPENPPDYVVEAPSPSTAQESGRSGDVIIVYGDKPSLGSQPQNSAAPVVPPTPMAPSTEGSATTIRIAPAASVPAAVSPPAAPAEAAPPAAKKPAPTAAPAKTAPSTAKAAPSTAKTAAPAAKTTSSAVKPTSAASGAWIQAGSFQTRSRADELKAAFAARGIEAAITVKDIDGKSYYQVKAGPYASREEAKKWLPTIRAVPGASEGAFITN